MMGRRRAASKDSGLTTLDSDLEELIGKNGVRIGGNDGGANNAASALNLDHLTNQKQDVMSMNQSSGSGRFSHRSHSDAKQSSYLYGRRMSYSEHCASYLSMLCYFYPRFCGCVVFGCIGIILFLLSSLGWNPEQEFGVIRNDHSNIQSKYDLAMGEIDHWCLGGGNDYCRCEDPLIPMPRNEFKSWIQALKANRKVVKRFEKPDQMKNLDVAIVGESIVEEMDGRWMGRSNRSKELTEVEKIFNSRFSKANGGHVEGVALGIAGDTAPNVLWRLLHGEMPDYFDPKVWWISLGNNDLARMECSEEVVVLGILRVVEEILEQRPKAEVVINSLFPMTETRGGLYPVISDYKDSFVRQRQRRLKPLQKSFRNERSQNVTIPRDLRTEEEMAYAAEVEEESRDKKHKKQHRKKKRHKNNPKMKDYRTMRKYQVGGTKLVRKATKPLWTSIRAINKELRKFADNQDRVVFYDATPLFVRKKSKAYTLLSDRISDRGHPTMHGFAVWEDEMVQRLVQILDRLKKEYPELFLSAGFLRSNRPVDNETDTENSIDLLKGPDDDDLDDAVFIPNDDGLRFNGLGAREDHAESIDDDERPKQDANDDESGGALVPDQASHDDDESNR